MMGISSGDQSMKRESGHQRAQNVVKTKALVLPAVTVNTVCAKQRNVKGLEQW